MSYARVRMRYWTPRRGTELIGGELMSFDDGEECILIATKGGLSVKLLEAIEALKGDPVKGPDDQR